MDLWEIGHHYNITNKELTNDVLGDLIHQIDTYFIPQIKRLESNSLLGAMGYER
jgi:hypothetical protein